MCGRYKQQKLKSEGGAHCASCHGDRYGTLANIQSERSRVYSVVSDGSMPRDNSEFNVTADGKNFLN